LFWKVVNTFDGFGLAWERGRPARIKVPGWPRSQEAIVTRRTESVNRKMKDAEFLT